MSVVAVDNLLAATYEVADRRGLPARVLAVEMILAATQAITGSYTRAGRQQDLACPTAANARSRRKRLFRELSNPTRRSPDSRACRSRPVMEWRKNAHR
jgi:hypothetical protein